ncbi:MAG: aminotransferase class III-fold pyridoxal phosphate-dependent enzyme [Bryobacteraceae bacterium]
MTKEEIILASQEYLFPAVFHYYREPLVIARAKDQYVWDADGNQYLDFFGGIVTISVGHANEQVNRKLHEQIDRLQHVSTLFATEPLAALAKKIASITPEGRLTKSFFTNSGSEANETAILAARCYTGSNEIIALRHSYHGRSALTMALSGQSVWRIGGASQPGVVFAHNAYCYRCPFGLGYPSCDLRCARDVEELIRTTTSGRVAGFIAEPVQGVGGFVTPPREYFGIVAGIVRNHGGIFISDEVQTGWGRTGGKWFGIEHWGVVAEVITSAKGLGNGVPIGLTVARPEVAASVQGLTISTFGGNPVAATAAKAVIDSRDGADAGPGTGPRPRDQGAGARGDRPDHGGGPGEPAAGGQGRTVRQRDPHFASAERFSRRYRRVRPSARGELQRSLIPVDERAFFNESQTTKPTQLNCPFCRTPASYDLRWLLRKKKDRLPPGADERDRARFQKAQSYMVLLDDKVACKNLRCRKRFDISGVKTMAFLSAEGGLPKGE